LSLSDRKRRLIWHGVLLVLLGLFTGVLIPLFTLAIGSGSVAILIAVGLVLYGLGSRTRRESP
jgi:VIT1/CCC1 family predicted Fe2+/Mn2+ transporter